MDSRTLLGLLQLMHTPGLGGKSIEKIINATNEEGYDLGDFMALSHEEQSRMTNIKPDILLKSVEQRELANSTRDRLLYAGIETVIKGEKEYPTHLVRSLGKTAPPVLFAKGNLKILEHTSVGFCGSRKASTNGLKITNDCTNELVSKDVNIVSGYAHGVDLAAHREALANNGFTTFVLAEGIFHFHAKQEVGMFLTETNYLAISEFPPGLRWATHNAMQRNRTICGLSDAVILVEAGTTGGTFEAGRTALELKIPLFAVEYHEPPESAEGNEYFLKHGAIALKSTAQGKPNLTQLWKILGETNEEIAAANSFDSEQLRLWND